MIRFAWLRRARWGLAVLALCLSLLPSCAPGAVAPLPTVSPSLTATPAERRGLQFIEFSSPF